MSRHFWAIVFCLFGISVLSAQGVDKTVSRALAEYFKNYTSPRTQFKYSALDRRRNNIVVNNKAKKVVIYVNEAFAGQAFTPEVVDKVYDDVRAILPKKLRKYRIEVVYKGRAIEERIPNIYRSRKDVDESRLWGSVRYHGAPWVKDVSRPFDIPSGLDGRHIALWQSHGRYYYADGDFWKWQRPSLYCTTEDLLTQSVVVPFLMPMLRNAGALVYTPRERDWQANCVIVDNDICDGGKSRYSESETRDNKWNTRADGYAPLKSVYYDRDDPFAMGSSRCANTTKNTNNGKRIKNYLAKKSHKHMKILNLHQNN